MKKNVTTYLFHNGLKMENSTMNNVDRELVIPTRVEMMFSKNIFSSLRTSAGHAARHAARLFWPPSKNISLSLS